MLRLTTIAVLLCTALTVAGAQEQSQKTTPPQGRYEVALDTSKVNAADQVDKLAEVLKRQFGPAFSDYLEATIRVKQMQATAGGIALVVFAILYVGLSVLSFLAVRDSEEWIGAGPFLAGASVLLFLIAATWALPQAMNPQVAAVQDILSQLRALR